MLVSQDYSCIDERAGREDRARFAGRAFEGELGEESGGGVGRDDDVVEIGRAVVDLTDYEIAGGGDVLRIC